MYLDNYINDINKLCKINGVKNLYAFGSVLTGNFNAQSDIDLMVEIETNDPIIYAERYFNLKFELQKLLKRQIDLLESKAIKNKFLKENIENTKAVIYAA